MKRFVATLSLFFLFSSCEIFTPKPESESFYCKIDGKAFRPDNGGDIFFEALLAKRSVENNLFYFIVYSEPKGWIGISAKFENIKSDFSEKTYVMNEEFRGHYSTPEKTVNGNSYSETYESYPTSGYITFTKIDTLKREVSGTFEFKAKDKKTDKIISVTKGQFNDVYFY